MTNCVLIFWLFCQAVYCGNTGIDDLPTVRSMLSLRKNNKNEINQNYVVFCEKFLRCIVGIKIFRSSCKKHKLSTYVSLSDEAFALLLLENSEHRWNSEIELKKNGNEVVEEFLLPTKYTGAGKSKQQKGFTKKFKGWTFEGIAKYNHLRDLIRKDRNENGVEFDSYMLNHFQKTCEAGENDAKSMEVSGYVQAQNDLFDDDFEKENLGAELEVDDESMESDYQAVEEV